MSLVYGKIYCLLATDYIPLKKKSLTSLQGLFILAPRPGLEPGTHGLTELMIFYLYL